MPDSLPPADLARHEDVPGWAIRLEAKVDIALAQHGSRLDGHDRDIAEIRSAHRELLAKKEDSHHAIEARLLTMERQPTVTPRQLGATVLGCIGALGAMAPFLDHLYK